MALLAYNLTGAPVTLAAGSPAPVLPASSNPPNRGPAVNVTSELRPDLAVDPTNGVAGGVDAAGFAAIQVQVAAADVQFEWTADPEYLVATLVAEGPLPGLHASTHATGQPDAIAEVTSNSTHRTGDGSDHAVVAANAGALANIQEVLVPVAGASPQTVAVAFPVPFPSPAYAVSPGYEDEVGGAVPDVVCMIDGTTKGTPGVNVIVSSIGGAPLNGVLNIIAKHP